MTPRQNNYFGAHFQAEQGARQGGIVLITIFNIIIDTVIRAHTEEMQTDDKATIILYADNVYIRGYNATMVQHTLDAFELNFKKFGLMTIWIQKLYKQQVNYEQLNQFALLMHKIYHWATHQYVR
jgi:hypothetical protein